MRLSLLIFAGVLSLSCSKKIVFRASSLVARTISWPITDFKQYFSSPDIPVSVVSKNPGIRRIEKIGDPNGCLYRGHLKPIEFPWTRITSSIDYEVDFVEGQYLSIRCNEKGFHHEFEGPMAGVLSSLDLSITGSGNFSIADSSNSFMADAQVSISFPVPDFLPNVVVNAIEDTGSSVIQNQIEGDLADLLDRVIVSSLITHREIGEMSSPQ
jgi:hypothetical protein